VRKTQGKKKTTKTAITTTTDTGEDYDYTKFTG